VAGDSTGDHALASSVAPVAPAWRPNHPYELAYARLTGRGQLVIRDADSGKVLQEASTSGPVRLLTWSDDGSRLLALAGHAALVFSADGHVLARYPGHMTDAALSPNGHMLALIRGADVLLASLIAGRVPRRVLSASGLGQIAWSPDGRWLLVTWPLADEWLLVPVARSQHVAAFTHVREQFHSFPRIEGWCCTPRGMS
jgi:Tol biopolymer transport system component